jgi:hypothetical protein
MANELLGNFRKLIDVVSADANYKPSNATLVGRMSVNCRSDPANL